MPSWRDRIAGLLGITPAQRPTGRKSQGKRAVSKTYVDGGGERAKLIKEAMTIYRSRRSEAYGLLNHALEQMRKNPPKTTSEHDNMVRVLNLHRAQVGLKALMSHDLRRHLVLSGIRGLLEETPASVRRDKSSGMAVARKDGRRTAAKR
jgi:hypothetical protein